MWTLLELLSVLALLYLPMAIAASCVEEFIASYFKQRGEGSKPAMAGDSNEHK